MVRYCWRVYGTAIRQRFSAPGSEEVTLGKGVAGSSFRVDQAELQGVLADDPSGSHGLRTELEARHDPLSRGLAPVFGCKSGRRRASSPDNLGAKLRAALTELVTESDLGSWQACLGTYQSLRKHPPRLGLPHSRRKEWLLDIAFFVGHVRYTGDGRAGFVFG